MPWDRRRPTHRLTAIPSEPAAPNGLSGTLNGKKAVSGCRSPLPEVDCVLTPLVRAADRCLHVVRLRERPARAGVRPDSPYGAHSMVYASAPSSFKEAMFREAAAVGASSIRVDVSVSAIARPMSAERDWSSLDEYIALARHYRLQVVGVLLGTPWWLAKCPRTTPARDFYKCPASDTSMYAGYIGEIAARARGVIDDWEIRNEPDGRWAYLGTPRDYAREFMASAAAIHDANPRARVLLGGLMTLASRGWLRASLAAGGTAMRTP